MRSNPRLGFPESEYRQRYDLVMDRTREANLDAMLVKNPENICYLSGYETRAITIFMRRYSQRMNR